MDTDKKLDPSEAAGASPVAPKSSSRRRLLQAGLGASPAILTFISMPVRADINTPGCRSASSFASLAAAQHAGVATSGAPLQQCMGVGPKTWKDSTFWPSGVGKETALFSTYFPSGVTFRSNGSPFMIEILRATAPDETEILIQNFVAAMLNVLSSNTPAAVVTQAQLATMFPQVMNGSYTPVVGGTPWTKATANNWFAQTFV